MKVILSKDVARLGKVGDVKEVSNGYAFNFLFPNELAEPATGSAMKRVETLKKKRAVEAADEKKALELAANALRDRSVVIRTKAEEGKLFGSVGSEEISAALSVDGIEVSSKSIILDKPFKEVGQYEVKAAFGHGVEAVFEVKVVGE